MCISLLQLEQLLRRVEVGLGAGEMITLDLAGDGQVDLVQMEGVVDAAIAKKSPLIIQTSVKGKRA